MNSAPLPPSPGVVLYIEIVLVWPGYAPTNNIKCTMGPKRLSLLHLRKNGANIQAGNGHNIFLSLKKPNGKVGVF